MTTGNVPRFAVGVIGALRGSDPAEAANARVRVARTLSVILGFALGCCLGAGRIRARVWSLVLAAGLAAVAFAIGFAAEA